LTSITGLEDAEVMMLPAGEENKVLEICFQVWEALTEYGIGRKDLIINLGGGVVTDTGGFIAAVFKRGVPFLHIPTSLLGMVDAAIGGKTGIDLGPYKNQLGTFSMPEMTIVDTAFLGTLPQEEVLNGFAEMVKHALIADIELWNAFLQLERIEANELMPFIEKSAAIKMQIVTEDPTEAGQRKLLNFGHTVGHALEGCFLSTETPISHGLAVVLGMIAEVHLSVELGYLSSHDQELIVSSLIKWFPLINIPVFENEQVIQLMKNDKKNSENKIKAALLKKTGKGIFDQISTDEGILSALDYLRQHIN
jgi:3-dehydroquinate synthase